MIMITTMMTTVIMMKMSMVMITHHPYQQEPVSGIMHTEPADRKTDD